MPRGRAPAGLGLPDEGTQWESTVSHRWLWSPATGRHASSTEDGPPRRKRRARPRAKALASGSGVARARRPERNGEQSAEPRSLMAPVWGRWVSRTCGCRRQLPHPVTIDTTCLDAHVRAHTTPGCRVLPGSPRPRHVGTRRAAHAHNDRDGGPTGPPWVTEITCAMERSVVGCPNGVTPHALMTAWMDALRASHATLTARRRARPTTGIVGGVRRLDCPRSPPRPRGCPPGWPAHGIGSCGASSSTRGNTSRDKPAPTAVILPGYPGARIASHTTPLSQHPRWQTSAVAGPDCQVLSRGMDRHGHPRQGDPVPGASGTRFTCRTRELLRLPREHPSSAHTPPATAAPVAGRRAG